MKPNEGKAAPAARSKESKESRIYGINACLAVFAHRPQAIRKIYILESQIKRFREALAWCAEQRIGYRVVGSEDLEKLTQSGHHEGVCFDILPKPVLNVPEFLRGQADARDCMGIWLDDVANPHNFGAILRVAAHFGANGVLVGEGAKSRLSGASYRVAEGGVEAVELVGYDNAALTLQQLRAAGFAFYGAVAQGEGSLYATSFGSKSILVFGAETTGISRALLAHIENPVTIPGTGAVESLNVATAVAAMLGEYRRQRPLRPS